METLTNACVLAVCMAAFLSATSDNEGYKNFLKLVMLVFAVIGFFSSIIEIFLGA